MKLQNLMFDDYKLEQLSCTYFKKDNSHTWKQFQNHQWIHLLEVHNVYSEKLKEAFWKKQNLSNSTDQLLEIEEEIVNTYQLLIRDYTAHRFGPGAKQRFKTVCQRIKSRINNRECQLLDLKQHIQLTLKLLQQGCIQDRMEFPAAFEHFLNTEGDKLSEKRYEAAK